jgi:hypothetical protein
MIQALPVLDGPTEATGDRRAGSAAHMSAKDVDHPADTLQTCLPRSALRSSPQGTPKRIYSTCSRRP